MWLKDVELVKIPLPVPARPPAPKKDPAPAVESILFKFTPDQKPITTELGLTIIKVEKDGWMVSNGVKTFPAEDYGPR